MTFPWLFGTPPPLPALTPRERMLVRLSEGVPAELASTAAGLTWDSVKNDADVVVALAEGEIALFERARDSGVTGTIRAAMRHETKTWTPKAEPSSGGSLEDLLRD